MMGLAVEGGSGLGRARGVGGWEETTRYASLLAGEMCRRYNGKCRPFGMIVVSVAIPSLN